MILLIPEGRTARKVMDPDLRPGPPKNCREVHRQYINMLENVQLSDEPKKKQEEFGGSHSKFFVQ